MDGYSDQCCACMGSCNHTGPHFYCNSHGGTNRRYNTDTYVAPPCPSCAALRKERDEALASIKRMQDYFGDVTITAKKLEEAEAALARYREAVNIDRETVGRIMHESWTRTKRRQGWHHPSEPCTNPYIKCGALSLPGNCGMQHADLVPWEQLPEMQKDINRHAFDDVLAELKRRAGVE